MPFLSSASSTASAGFGRSSSALYAFTSFTFTNAGQFGAIGPTLAELQSAYSATSWTQSSSNLNVITRGYQLWTVPESGSYQITAAGAAGGSNISGSSASGTAGYGRIVRGTAQLVAGEKINILVGQRGQCGNRSGNQAFAGGGGSFVFKEDLTLLLVGAGGNGENWESHTTRIDAQASTGSVVSSGSGRGSIGAGWTANGTNSSGSVPSGQAENIRNSTGRGANFNAGTAELSNFGTASATFNLAGGFGGGGTATPYEGGGGGGFVGGLPKPTNQYSGNFPNHGALSYINTGVLTSTSDVGLHSDGAFNNASSLMGYVTILKV